MNADVARLAVEGLGKTYADDDRRGGVTALDGVDLHVGRGEFVAIVGPSGCGKSTLLNILAGLVAPSSGRVLLDGVEPRELLGSLGYMPQKDLLMPWRTVLDNVTLGLEINGMARAPARARARDELARFGLAGFEHRWPASLSGGMRRRAALLRTFLAGRELLLLDEPFGALDALTRQALHEWLLDVWQAQRKTVVLVTHDVDEALYLADRVYAMSRRPGRMQLCVEVGLPRPRTLAMRLSDEFTALKRRLMMPLHEAARQQLEEVA